MTRPTFGKMKTIVLPIPEDSYSVQTYKDEFGIDLTNYISFEDSEIRLSFPNNAIILLDCSRLGIGAMGPGVKFGLIPATDTGCNALDPGNSDAVTSIGVYNSLDGAHTGLGFIVDKNADLTIENIRIRNV